jgi:hypothetical protein
MCEITDLQYGTPLHRAIQPGWLLCEIPRLAGSPKKRDLNEQLVAKAHVLGVQPLDYIIDRIESGEYIWQIAQDFGASDSMLRRWCYAQPQGRRRYSEATAERAHSVVEGGMKRIEELKNVEVTKGEAMLLKLELDQRRFIAGTQNRPVYGQQPEVQVNVNLDSLMLEAFKQTRTLSRGHITPQLGDGQPDVEVVPSGEQG